MLEEEQLREPKDRAVVTTRNAAAPQLLVFDDERETGAAQMPLLTNEAANSAPSDEAIPPRIRATADKPALSKFAPPVRDRSVEFAPAASELPEITTAKSALLGESTPSAGLYFLLNVLRSLGIAAALEACPALAESDLASHILRHLATCAGVADNDPILLCLPMSQALFALPEEILTNLPLQPAAWPKGFAVSLRASFDSNHSADGIDKKNIDENVFTLITIEWNDITFWDGFINVKFDGRSINRGRLLKRFPVKNAKKSLNAVKSHYNLGMHPN